MKEQIKEIKSNFWIMVILGIIGTFISKVGGNEAALAGLLFYIPSIFFSYKIYKTFSTTSNNALIIKYWWYGFWVQVAIIIPILLAASGTTKAAGFIGAALLFAIYFINIALYNEVSKVTKNKLFFIGSTLLIAFGLGFLLIFITFIKFDKIYTIEELENS